MILNGELLEEVDCFKYLGSQVAVDGGCERDAWHSAIFAGTVFFRSALPCSGGYHIKRGGNAVT